MMVRIIKRSQIMHLSKGPSLLTAHYVQQMNADGKWEDCGPPYSLENAKKAAQLMLQEAEEIVVEYWP